MVGCYEPSLPAPSGSATYSIPPGVPTSFLHTATTASYSGPVVVATNPPSPPPYLPGNTTYPLQGCYKRNGGVPIVAGFSYNDPQYMTVDACFAYCSQFAFLFLSVEGGKYGALPSLV